MRRISTILYHDAQPPSTTPLWVCDKSYADFAVHIGRSPVAMLLVLGFLHSTRRLTSSFTVERCFHLRVHAALYPRPQNKRKSTPCKERLSLPSLYESAPRGLHKPLGQSGLSSCMNLMTKYILGHRCRRRRFGIKASVDLNMPCDDQAEAVRPLRQVCTETGME